VAALVRLLGPLDVSAPAVRTAVSRMVRQGWLTPVRTATGPGYAITARARARLDDAARRIYRTADAPWDGCWDLVVLPPVQSRAARDRLRASLGFLGYALLGGGTWVAARAVPELEATVAAEKVSVHRFRSTSVGDPAALARTVWDLDWLATAYDGWQQQAEQWIQAAGDGADDESRFALRSQLVHEWRKFLFRDPGLPAALLPADWPGHAAAAFFDREQLRLAPAAGRFVDACLDRRGGPA